jgi:hypothetical protein
MKTCTTCTTTKSFSEFHKGKAYKDGYRSKCKQCISEYYKERNYTPELKQKHREWSYKRRYGITPSDYDQMLSDQNGACKICGSKDSKKGDHRFMVDHCHTTGKVRGLLCGPCNSAIGLLGDNISTLQAAINYLSTHTHT